MTEAKDNKKKREEEEDKSLDFIKVDMRKARVEWKPKEKKSTEDQ
jgi:hypothetical protein